MLPLFLWSLKIRKRRRSYKARIKIGINRFGSPKQKAIKCLGEPGVFPYRCLMESMNWCLRVNEVLLNAYCVPVERHGKLPQARKSGLGQCPRFRVIIALGTSGVHGNVGEGWVAREETRS